MCELFGLSAADGAAAATLSAAFADRASREGAPADGWGIAHHDGVAWHLSRSSSAAEPSKLARALEEGARGGLVIAHLRKATQGALDLRNTQPFARERWGVTHVFAHNGDLDAQAMHAAFPLRRERPDGETDSEYAFCLLLEWLEPLWRGGSMPGVERRFQVVSRLAAMLRRLGPFNFLYSDGDVLFAHAHRRMHPGHVIAPPGLHLRRERGDTPARGSVLLASVPPSTAAAWVPMPEAEVIAVRHGKPLCAPGARASTSRTLVPC